MKQTEIKVISQELTIMLMLALACALAGCDKEPRLIEGMVVDGAGNSLAEASVTSCYSGWGWSNGSLVWDKDFCSEPVSTDIGGRFFIEFDGPESMRLLAHKEGWQQTRDAKSGDSQIVMTALETLAAREKARREKEEAKATARKTRESDTEYYCRVVMPRNNPVRLNYRGKVLSITPSLLTDRDRVDGVFAVRGEAETIESLAGELLLMLERQVAGKAVFSASTDEGCPADVLFVRVKPTIDKGFRSAGDFEILVPGVSAMFDITVWSSPGTRQSPFLSPVRLNRLGPDDRINFSQGTPSPAAPAWGNMNPSRPDRQHP